MCLFGECEFHIDILAFLGMHGEHLTVKTMDAMFTFMYTFGYHHSPLALLLIVALHILDPCQSEPLLKRIGSVGITVLIHLPSIHLVMLYTCSGQWMLSHFLFCLLLTSSAESVLSGCRTGPAQRPVLCPPHSHVHSTIPQHLWGELTLNIRMVLYRAKFLQVCEFELFVRAKIFDHSFHILTARQLSFTSLRASMDTILDLSYRICQPLKLDPANLSVDHFQYYTWVRIVISAGFRKTKQLHCSNLE